MMIQIYGGKAQMVKIDIGSEDQTFNLLVDTGSSWNWVQSCGPNFKGECPAYYFNTSSSSSLECTEEYKYIRYASMWINGQLCKDTLHVYNTGDMRVKMPFLLDHQTHDGHNGNRLSKTFDGIMGLAPDDESSGPLFINHLYKAGKIKERKFSIIVGVIP